MRPLLILPFLLLCAGCIAGEEEEEIITPRGRVRVENGTVVTDGGTLLRGAYWSTDWAGELPRKQDLAALRAHGLNAVHLYAEMYSGGYEPGHYTKQVDQVVNWCGELGLYCVMTIGGGTRNGSYSLDFLRRFWSHYAPRYKDKPWVLYEIMNEPHAWSAPYPDSTRAMQQEIYDLIRQKAPDSHILLLSYALLTPLDGVLEDIESLEVDWTNASVAWHGYGNTVKPETIAELKRRGIPSMSTELPVHNDQVDPVVDPLNVMLCEMSGVSWLVFLRADQVADVRRFRGPLESSGARWAPDY